MRPNLLLPSDLEYMAVKDGKQSQCSSCSVHTGSILAESTEGNSK